MRPRVKSYIIGAVNILLGFAIGVTTAPLVQHWHHHKDPEYHFERIVQRLTEDLELTQEQQAPIRQIMEKTRDQFRELHESVRPRIDEIELTSHSEMKKHLNQEQQQKLDQIAKKLRERGRSKGRHGPPLFRELQPPPPPPQ